MATTKQAERAETDALVADEYLSDLVYDALLERGEPSKVSEITLEINNPKVTFPVVRRILTESPRFLSVDRLWTLKARYLDRSRPTERNLIEVIAAAGKPLSTATLASELSEVYARPSETYFPLLAKLLVNQGTYFKTARGEYGLTAWLPLLDAEEEDDILSDNQVKRISITRYAEASKNAGWSPTTYADATRAILDFAKKPLSHRLIGVLGYLALGAKYDARAHLVQCLADPGLVWLSRGRWVTRAFADRLENLLEERGAAMAAAGESTEEAPAPVAVAAPVVEVPAAEEAPSANGVAADAAAADAADATAPVVEAPAAAAPAAEVSTPLEVSEEALRAMEQIVTERGGAVEASELLALQYEVVPGDPSYRADVEALTERLKNDDRFQYVGAGRFREPNSLPLFVFSVPESLTFPELQFVSLDGEIMDEEIEDEGYVGTLRQDVLSPLAQDVGDDEGRYTGPAYEPGTPVRCVVKAHHKEIGTFPLCQFPDGFLPDDAPVAEIVIRDANGEAHDVIVNNEVRLAFNLFGLYEALTADSGAVFYLHPTARPYEFRFEARPEETDPQVYIAPQRVSELLALREQAEESGDLATFDIACEVLAPHVKGLDFVQYLTEVNLVRRVTRRKLASILSNYLCFFQKAGQPLWRFDAKKRDLGTDRAKRKYLKR